MTVLSEFEQGYPRLEKLPEIKLTEEHNYVAAFITFDCSLGCGYCINSHDSSVANRKSMTGKEWVAALNRFISRDDLPITLQGGEPTSHDDFYYIVNNVRDDLKIDLLTNLQFDEDVFIKNVKPSRFFREAPYASIRASLHPATMKIDETIERTKKLMAAGFSIGLYLVMHPDYAPLEPDIRKRCDAAGIDFRTKEFLGRHNGRLFGTYRWEGCCEGKELKNVLCRTSEVLIAPDGILYRCHHDLYNAVDPLVHVLSPYISVRKKFMECDHFGLCNPCDVKVKTNRLQEFGHTSVEIIFEAEPPAEDKGGGW